MAAALFMESYLLLIGLTQTAYEFVIASPLGRGNLLVKCCDNRRSTRRFPRRSAPRNDRLAVCLNKADKHFIFYKTTGNWILCIKMSVDDGF